MDAKLDEPPARSQSRQRAAPALASAVRFLRHRWLAVLGVSALLLAPCFWHRFIQAGDLASHVYNAWLAQLISRGDVPGLWIAGQWANTLFDLSLASLGTWFGLAAAEKIVVSASVLIFFWGAFSLASAAALRAGWPVTPCLAIFAYGWTFQMGFFNYYLALGLSFFALALLWRGQGWERAVPLALAPLIWMAHPLGVVFLACAGVWILLAGNSSRRRQLLLGIAAVALILAVRFYLVGAYRVFWSPEPSFIFNGFDQMLLYGPHYRFPRNLLLAFVVLSLAADVLRRRAAGERLIAYVLPVQLYGLALLAVQVLPKGFLWPNYAAPASYLTERLPLICAVLICCLLAVMKPRIWHVAASTAIAAVFFSHLYADTARISRLEDQARNHLRTLPPGRRVIAAIPPLSGSRVVTHHIVDRACVGHCFSYGNYEPSSRQFRVRARPGNPFVVAHASDAEAILRGRYIVRPEDLPMFQIHSCGPDAAELCLRELAAGPFPP